MINFSTPSKKDINKIFEKFSIFLSDKFNSLSSINLKKISIYLFMTKDL